MASKTELLNELKAQSSETNRRLRDLHKHYPNDTWSEKILYSKLNTKYEGLTPTGRVKANKKMSESEIKASLKAVNNFLADKRSTVEGLEEVKQKLQDSISKNLQENIEGITAEDADNLVQLFEDENAKNVMKYIPPSDLFRLVTEAKGQHLTQKSFIDMARDYIDFSENKGIVKRLKGFYRSYLKK